MRLRAAIIASTLAVAACAPRVAFVRPDTGPADHSRDMAQCEYEIQMNQPGGRYVRFRTAGEAVGYTIGAAIGRSLRNDQLRALCMQGRGYMPVALDGAPTPISEPQAYLPAIAPSQGTQPGRGDIPAAPPVPVAATPTVAGIKTESKYMITAEGVAKATGCAPPSMAMTAKGAGSESFMVGCPNGTTLAIRCEIDGCRILR